MNLDRKLLGKKCQMPVNIQAITFIPRYLNRLSLIVVELPERAVNFFKLQRYLSVFVFRLKIDTNRKDENGLHPYNVWAGSSRSRSIIKIAVYPADQIILIPFAPGIPFEEADLDVT